MPRGDFDTSEICLWWWLLDLVISESLSLWDASFSQDLLEASLGQLFPSYAGGVQPDVGYGVDY